MITKSIFIITVFTYFIFFATYTNADTGQSGAMQQMTNIETQSFTRLSPQDKADLEKLISNESLYFGIVGLLSGAIFMLLPILLYLKSGIKEKISVTNDRLTYTNDKLSDEFRNIERIQLDTTEKHRSIEGSILEIKKLSESSKKEIKLLRQYGKQLDPALQLAIEKKTSKIMRKINKSTELAHSLAEDFSGIQRQLVELDVGIQNIEARAVEDLTDAHIAHVELVRDVSEIKSELLTSLNHHNSEINNIKNDIHSKLDNLQTYIDHKISTLIPLDYSEVDRRAEHIFEQKYDEIR